MTLILGAPVADRAWALPRWLDCIASQTIQPDRLVFIHSDTGDGTREILGAEKRWPVTVIDTPQPFVRRELRLKDRVGTTSMLADLRNRLLIAALDHEVETLFSLDTDVFLTDPGTIKKLLGELVHAPLAAPYVNLSPHGPCANAAQWRQPTSRLPAPTQRWDRCERDETTPGRVLVDIPMAAVMMRREVVISCAYRYHEAGEDMGFAQDLDRRGEFKTAWLTGWECPHVMDRNHIGVLDAAAAV